MGSHLSVIETRFSASEYTHVSPTSTQAAQGSGGFPAQRVFRERHRLHLSKKLAGIQNTIPMRARSRFLDSRDWGSPVGAVLVPSNNAFATDHCRESGWSKKEGRSVKMVGSEFQLISWQVHHYQGICFSTRRSRSSTFRLLSASGVS